MLYFYQDFIEFSRFIALFKLRSLSIICLYIVGLCLYLSIYLQIYINVFIYHHTNDVDLSIFLVRMFRGFYVYSGFALMLFLN